MDKMKPYIATILYYVNTLDFERTLSLLVALLTVIYLFVNIILKINQLKAVRNEKLKKGKK